MTDAGRATPRYAVLDTYRYIAALGIVLFHFEGQFFPEREGIGDSFGRFHLTVDFFFVLSGFVLMHTYGTSLRSVGDVVRFIQKRLARIYPLHFATTLGFVGLALLIQSMALHVNSPQTFDVKFALPHLLLVHAWGATSHLALDYPSWSISAEFFVYLLFPLFVAILAYVKPIGTLVIAIIIAVAMAYARQGLGLQTFLHATYDFGNFRALPSFLAGMAIEVMVASIPVRQVNATPKGHKIYWFAAHGFGAFICICMLAHAPEPIIFILLPMAVTLVAIAERRGTQSILAQPFFTRLGDCSYGLYLLHPFVAIAIAFALRKLGWATTPGFILGAVMGILFSTLAAYVSFRWFETPMRRLLSRRLPWPVLSLYSSKA